MIGSAIDPRAKHFGAADSVLRYNCFSLFLIALLVRILSLPLSGTLAISASSRPREVRRITLHQAIRFFSIIRIPQRQGNSDSAQTITYLGLSGCFARPSNGVALRISLAPIKATIWADSIATYLRGRSLPEAGLEALIGRRHFARPTTSNRLARWVMKPLYLMPYARPIHTLLVAACPSNAILAVRRACAPPPQESRPNVACYRIT